MVKVVDISEERKRDKERNEKIKGLIREIFNNNPKKPEALAITLVGGASFFVSSVTAFDPIKDGICSIHFYKDVMELRDASYEEVAVKFAEEYEKRALLKSGSEFVIKKDYSH
jgi:hypothetical protein